MVSGSNFSHFSRYDQENNPKSAENQHFDRFFELIRSLKEVLWVILIVKNQ
jgi:hypothetical protein